MSKVRQVLAVIDRDATTKMPVTVFEWELPVLEEIHGAGRVFEVSSEDIDTDLTAVAAFSAMLSKYSQQAGLVRFVYRGGARALAKAAKLPLGDEGAETTQQAQVIIRKPHLVRSEAKAA